MRRESSPPAAIHHFTNAEQNPVLWHGHVPIFRSASFPVPILATGQYVAMRVTAAGDANRVAGFSPLVSTADRVDRPDLPDFGVRWGAFPDVVALAERDEAMIGTAVECAEMLEARHPGRVLGVGVRARVFDYGVCDTDDFAREIRDIWVLPHIVAPGGPYAKIPIDELLMQHGTILVHAACGREQLAEHDCVTRYVPGGGWLIAEHRPGRAARQAAADQRRKAAAQAKATKLAPFAALAMASSGFLAAAIAAAQERSTAVVCPFSRPLLMHATITRFQWATESAWPHQGRYGDDAKSMLDSVADNIGRVLDIESAFGLFRLRPRFSIRDVPAIDALLDAYLALPDDAKAERGCAALDFINAALKARAKGGRKRPQRKADTDGRTES